MVSALSSEGLESLDFCILDRDCLEVLQIEPPLDEKQVRGQTSSSCNGRSSGKKYCQQHKGLLPFLLGTVLALVCNYNYLGRCDDCNGNRCNYINSNGNISSNNSRHNSGNGSNSDNNHYQSLSSLLPVPLLLLLLPLLLLLLLLLLFFVMLIFGQTEKL